MELPKVEDFTWTPRPEDDSDGFVAWKNFGGLELEEAYQKFCEIPENYQEDFMWMGDSAFMFYFPVIDRYIREKEPEFEVDGKKYAFGDVTHILGHCIEMHVSEKRPSVRPLYDQITRLCRFVIDGLRDVPADREWKWSPQATEHVWTELMNKTLSLTQRESK